MRQVSFGEVLLLCDQEPLGDIDPQISWRRISKLQSRGDYSRFMDFDYVGAVWPQFDDHHNVGNGGFSLRSRRLLDACRELPFQGSESEDVVIGRICRSRLQAQGIRFAPASVAHRFAYERTKPSGHEFGFHGAFNLVELVSSKDALRIFRELESGMLARNEQLELFRWALKRGRVGLAAAMLKRLL